MNQKKNKGGRPPIEITPELSKTICDAIGAGAFVETAVALAGISKPTFYEWIKRGAKATRGPHKEFSDAVKKALAHAETRYMLVIGQASKTQWQAAAWMLERRFGRNWAKRSENTSAQTSSTSNSGAA